jgi:hypothetical protein
MPGTQSATRLRLVGRPSSPSMVTIPQQFPSEIATPTSAHKSLRGSQTKISTSPHSSMEQPQPQFNPTRGFLAPSPSSTPSPTPMT